MSFFISKGEDDVFILEDNSGIFSGLSHKLEKFKSEGDLIILIRNIIEKYEFGNKPKMCKDLICDNGFINCFNDIRFRMLNQYRIYFSVDDEKLGNIVVWCDGEDSELKLSIRLSASNFEMTGEDSTSKLDSCKPIDYKITDEDLERWTSPDSIYRWIRDKACSIHVGNYWIEQVSNSKDLPKTLESFRKDLD